MPAPRRILARINTLSLGFFVGRGKQSRMEIADQHNEIEINLVERGAITLQHGPDTISLPAGGTVIYWAAIPHQVIAVEPHTEIAWLVMPLAWFLSWNLAAALRKHLLYGRTLTISAHPSSKAIIPPPMTRWATDFASSVPERQRAIELELEAFCRRLSTSDVLQKARPTRRLADSNIPLGMNQCTHVQRMVRFMTEHSAEPITISQLARTVGLNPEYAMRLFRKNWGMTIWEFLLQQRICQAQRLLLLSDAKVVDIAFQCGFGSASRFYDAFSKQCHCTPLAFRKKAEKTLRAH